jgi:hypothetical protein
MMTYSCESPMNIMSAERAGFEPAIPLRVYKLSRLARSTTLTPLRIIWTANVTNFLRYICFSIIISAFHEICLTSSLLPKGLRLSDTFLPPLHTFLTRAF